MSGTPGTPNTPNTPGNAVRDEMFRIEQEYLDWRGSKPASTRFEEVLDHLFIYIHWLRQGWAGARIDLRNLDKLHQDTVAGLHDRIDRVLDIIDGRQGGE